MRHYYKKKGLWLLAIILVFGTMGCEEEPPGDHARHDEGNRNQSLKLKIDLGGSAGMIVTDGSSSAAARHLENARYLGIEPKAWILRQGEEPFSAEAAGNLQKIDEEGNVGSVIEVEDTNVPNQLPSVRTIGMSGAGDVYFHFEHHFVYRDEDDNGEPCSDPWSESSPCSCQIFKALDTVQAMAGGSALPEFGNIECLDNHHIIDSHGRSTAEVFQFDRESNVYYAARLPDSSQTVIYKVLRDKQNGQYVQKEMVNANICVNDFRVTKNAGMFYVGQNCIDGQWTGGDGTFFRYVSPNGSLTEISRNWWDFTFEPIEGVDTDKVLFYGPNPDSNEVASWDSACLFEFDPSQSTGSRSAKLVTCNQNLWDWLEMRRFVDTEAYGNHNPWNSPPLAWRTEYQRRCLSDSDTFIGGGSGSPVKSIKQTTDGRAFIVGNISRKKAGTFKCNLEIRGAHCVINNVPALRNASGSYTKTTCSTDGGTWTDKGWCDGKSEHNQNSSACIADAQGTWQGDSQWYSDIQYQPTGTTNYESGHVCLEKGETKDSWSKLPSNTTAISLRINGVQCESPPSTGSGDSWTTQYKGLAYVNKTTGQLELRSSTQEQVSDMWLINDEFYYAGFQDGLYSFKKESVSSTNVLLLSDFEVYHVNASPRGGGLILFDGLNFSNNNYTFGDLNPNAEDVQSSIVTAEGLTGRVKTMVIYGSQ